MKKSKVLILGGYGNFGKRIAENLSLIENIEIIISGRNEKKANALCNELILNGASADVKSAILDIHHSDFSHRLNALSPNIVIHTGGPFQGQDYRVPEACLSVGSHYIDLADDRRFVCDITELNDQAKDKKVLLVSGASSVPGLSSAVVDHFMARFSKLDEIDMAIAPGNKAERGEATVKGILSYTGHSFQAFKKGRWIEQYGWMSPRKLWFGKAIGNRWLANLNVPDLELFPKRYTSVNTVNFQAGLELPILHFGMVLMAFLTKKGLVKNWSKFTAPIFHSSEVFKYLGTSTGGMQVNLSGYDVNNTPISVKWNLCAEDGVGPFIPTISAIILAKKLMMGSINETGAMPCLGLFTMDEFDEEATRLGIYHQTEVING